MKAVVAVIGFFGFGLMLISVFFALAYGQSNPFCLPNFFDIMGDAAQGNPFSPRFLSSFAEAFSNLGNAFDAAMRGPDGIDISAYVWAIAGNIFTFIGQFLWSVVLILITPIEFVVWIVQIGQSMVLHGCYVLPSGVEETLSSALIAMTATPFPPLGV